MKNFIVVNRNFNIPLASVLYKTSPLDMKVILIHFNYGDEYNWPKPKSINKYFTDKDIKNCKNFFGDDFIVVENVNDYKKLVDGSNLCISLGRELFIFKQNSNKNVAMSGMRDYFPRYISLIDYYENYNVVLDSPSWLSKEELKTNEFEISDTEYDIVDEHKEIFKFVDPLNEYKNILSGIGVNNIRNEFGINHDSKVALVSLRRADDWHTIYQSDDEFYETSLNTLKKFKDEGYFIICRRRVGLDDVNNRRHNSAENLKYNEFKKYIDLEISDWGGYPDVLFKLCYLADIMLLMDTSNIASKEGAICELPVYMPYDENNYFFQNQVKRWNPATKDMINFNVMTNDLSDDFFNNFSNNINDFNDKWHYGNIDNFWNLIEDMDNE